MEQEEELNLNRNIDRADNRELIHLLRGDLLQQATPFYRFSLLVKEQDEKHEGSSPTTFSLWHSVGRKKRENTIIYWKEQIWKLS